MNGKTCWSAFRELEVICTKDGRRLGHPIDLEFDADGQILSLTACAPGAKPGQLFRRPPRFRVCWKDLCRVGEELLLTERYETCAPNMNKL